jgi:hypothetical protein
MKIAPVFLFIDVRYLSLISDLLISDFLSLGI